MKKSKFEKPPKILTAEEKEAIAKEFISEAEGAQSSSEKDSQTEKSQPKKKSMVFIHLRILESLQEEIQEIMGETGLTRNAVCAHILRKGVKSWKKELEEE